MCLIENPNEYDPKKEYYFVDYQLISDIRWVRNPLNTIEEVQEIVANLPYVYDRENDEVLPMFEDLRITPHKHLEKLYKKYNEEKEEWEDDEITNGCVMFDYRYDHNEWIVEGWLPSLSKDGKETKEEWEKRVEERKQVNEQALKKSWEEHERRRKLWEAYPSETYAFLLGKAKKRDKEELNKKNRVEVVEE